MQKRSFFLFIVAMLGVALVGIALLGAQSSRAATQTNSPQLQTDDPAGPPRAPRPDPVVQGSTMPPLSPAWNGTWQYGPSTTFTFSRFDAAFYSGDGLVYFLGGRLPDNTTDGSVWSFDPATGTYTDMGVDMPTPISNYEIQILQDSNGWGLYIFCGRPAAGGVVDFVQVYYPDTNTTAQLPAGDDYPGTGTCSSGLQTTYNNKVYTAGGFDAVSNFSETWVFDPMAASGSRWTQLASATLTTARAYIMSAVVDDMIYAIGGSSFDGTNLINLQIVEVLDPNAATPVWDDAAALDLPEPCSESRAWGFDSTSSYVDPDGTPLAGKIVSGCGFWSTANNHVLVYDTHLNFWEDFPYLNDARRSEAATFLPVDGSIANGVAALWAWGGYDSTGQAMLNTSEYYGVEQGSACQVLLVDDDWDFTSPNFGGRYYYTSTLDTLGYNYSVWDTGSMGTPTSTDMDPYNVVVWFTGYDWQTPISPTEEAELVNYLNAGGNVLVSDIDQNYAFGLTPLMTEYFWVDTAVDDVAITNTVGNPADPLFSGLGPYTLARPDQWDAYWPTGTFEGPWDDEVYARSGGFEPTLYDSTGAPNGTRYNGGNFKTIYFGWPLEWVPDVNDRADIMGNALSWLCAPNTTPFDLIPPFQQGSAPAGTTITYTMAVVNNLGYAETFSMTYDALWPVDGPAAVGPIADGDSAEFLVTVDVPAGENCYVEDTASIFAIDQSTGVYTDTATIVSSIGPDGTGGVDGTVIDANTGSGIPNAYVFLQLGDAYYDTYSDSDGVYVFGDIPSGCTYETVPSAAGYQFNYPPLYYTTVVPDVTVTSDLTMTAPLMTLSQDAFNVSLAPGERYTVTLLITNSGTADLSFGLDTMSPSTFAPVGNLALPFGDGKVDPQLRAALTDAPNGQADILIIMAEQADVSAGYTIEDWSVRGKYVYDTLKATAERSQSGVLRLLDAQQYSYRTFYALNGILVHNGNSTLLDQLAARPEVGYLTVNGSVQLEEPHFALATYGPPAEASTIEWGVTRVNADDVWTTYSDTGEGIVVANIDTGVEWTHDALVSQYRGGPGSHDYNWYMPTNVPECGDGSEPCDNDGHGTHTMGTMVGDDGGSNQIGVAPGAEWIACKGCEYNSCSFEALLACGDWMVAPTDTSGANPNPDMRPNVINNSWGGGGGDFWYAPVVSAWRASGMFPQFSAGNAGPNCSTTGSPGDYWLNFAAAAVDIADNAAGFSARGPADITGLLKPNISGPGVGIRSSVPGNGYGFSSGTSMASPHIAGVVALLWSADPELIGDIVGTMNLLSMTAAPLYTTDTCGGNTLTDHPNYTFGYGMVDALAAVDAATAGEQTVPWVELYPDGGILAPGSSMEVKVVFQAPEVTGTYTGTLYLTANEPYNPMVSMNLNMTVEIPSMGGFEIYLPIIYKPTTSE
ncbi:MAG: S8 family serine peptidase [Anaerolineales bacterium]|nr:S8 family serine peptidase [Anaerolineales bacterium]